MAGVRGLLASGDFVGSLHCAFDLLGHDVGGGLPGDGADAVDVELKLRGGCLSRVLGAGF